MLEDPPFISRPEALPSPSYCPIPIPVLQSSIHRPPIPFLPHPYDPQIPKFSTRPTPPPRLPSLIPLPPASLFPQLPAPRPYQKPVLS